MAPAQPHYLKVCLAAFREVSKANYETPFHGWVPASTETADLLWEVGHLEDDMAKLAPTASQLADEGGA